MKNNRNELTSFEPEHNFLSLREAMNTLFDESVWSPFDRNLMSNFSRNNSMFPKVNISEIDKKIIVTANVPGIKTDDISVEISDNILTISGKVEKESKEENKNEKYYRYEREFGSFSRSFSLPNKVDENKIEAETKNGVLTITLPKLEIEEKKKIQIKDK
jgi:HSP20 family protein